MDMGKHEMFEISRETC